MLICSFAKTLDKATSKRKLKVLQTCRSLIKIFISSATRLCWPRLSISFRRNSALSFWSLSWLWTNEMRVLGHVISVGQWEASIYLEAGDDVLDQTVLTTQHPGEKKKLWYFHTYFKGLTCFVLRPHRDCEGSQWATPAGHGSHTQSQSARSAGPAEYTIVNS